MEDEKLVEIRVLVPADVRDRIAQGVKPSDFAAEAGRLFTRALKAGQWRPGGVMEAAEQINKFLGS